MQNVYQFMSTFRPETQYNIFLTNVSSFGLTTCTRH